MRTFGILQMLVVADYLPQPLKVQDASTPHEESASKPSANRQGDEINVSRPQGIFQTLLSDMGIFALQSSSNVLLCL
jgi:hypothetical protein